MRTIRYVIAAVCLMCLVVCPVSSYADSVTDLKLSDADRATFENFRNKAGKDRISEGRAIDAIFIQRYNSGATGGVEWLKKPILKLRPTKSQLIELLGTPTYESAYTMSYDLGGTHTLNGGIHGSALVTLASGRLADYSTLVDHLGHITKRGSRQEKTGIGGIEKGNLLKLPSE